MSALVEHVPSLGLAFLCTPSDCLAIPAGAHQAAKAASGFSFGKPLETFFNLASMGKVYVEGTAHDCARGCYYYYYYHHHYYYHSLPRFSGARPTPPTPSSPPRAGPRSLT